jgi:dethiobiotin synthase
MFRGIFVTGTDTNVGKTVVSAALLARYRAEVRLRYWKPIQTGARDSGLGTRGDDDTAEVARLSQAREEEIVECGIRLPDPVSPHLAAQRAGIRLAVKAAVSTLHDMERSESRAPSPDSRPRWIIEGAGGVLVPINERETMADLMEALDLPVVVAARSSLGTINHTCMTIEVLRRRMLRVAGIVMVGEPNDENRLAIEKYGAAEVIGQMPRFDPLTPAALTQWASTELDRSGVLFVAALR